MGTPAITFDTSIPKWLEEQQTAWSRLKYTITRANLDRHLEPQLLTILDAGGGNGVDSIPFAAEGHKVTIVDFSSEMLADAQQKARDVQAHDRVTTHLGDVMSLPKLLPDAQFDLILCHNVLQYVGDVHALLAGLVVLLNPGGLLSLISVNRYSVPYQAAFMHSDLVAAHTKLDQREVESTIFGTTMKPYSAEEIIAILPEVGCVVEQDYGIRCICDYWGDNERKSDPEVYAQLERLELTLTDQHPYKLLARYFQIVARKQRR